MFGAGSEVGRNRALWTQVNADFTDADALRAWTAESITWGLFNIPEDDLGVLGDVAGLDVVELGCGTAYFAAWLARRGARPVGVDVTPAQLATARRCQQQLDLFFWLVEASADAVPLRGGLFDLVISEYGASLWCDPARWVPEAARLLKPGGRLVFLTNSVLATLTVPLASGFAGQRLLRSQRDIYRTAWPGGGIEYHPSHGEWVRILRHNGFEVQALHELYAPADAGTHQYYEIVTQEWAQRWPAEDLWQARLTRRADSWDDLDTPDLQPSGRDTERTAPSRSSMSDSPKPHTTASNRSSTCSQLPLPVPANHPHRRQHHPDPGSCTSPFHDLPDRAGQLPAGPVNLAARPGRPAGVATAAPGRPRSRSA